MEFDTEDQVLLFEFSTKRLPPPLVEKNWKNENDLHAMKQILYDMGPPTLVRWPLYRALKVWHALRNRIQAKGLQTKKFKTNKCTLKWSIGKIQCFTTTFF